MGLHKNFYIRNNTSEWKCNCIKTAILQTIYLHENVILFYVHFIAQKERMPWHICKVYMLSKILKDKK